MLRNRLVSTAAYLLAPPDAPGSSAGGGGSSPAPTPPSSAPAGGASSTVAPGVESPPSSGAAPATDDFMSIFDGPQAPVTETPPATTPATTPQAPSVAPALTPAAAAPPATPGVAAGQGDGGPQPAVTPQPSDQRPVLDPYDPMTLVQAIQQNEQATIDYVAQSMFALTQEDAQALETDVIGTVPKLFAKAFVKQQMNMLMQIGRILPELVRRHTDSMRTQASNEDSFYTRWPQIDKEKHRDLVNRYGVAYRTMHPQITREQMIEDLGPMVIMAAKIPISGGPAAAAPPGSNGAAPARAAHQPTPFTPAVPGPAAAVTQTELNPWEAMFNQPSG